MNSSKRQAYQQLNFFPIQCYEFHCDDALLNGALGLVKDMEYRSYNEPAGVMTTDDIHQREEFAPMMSWAQECVDTIHFDQSLNCDRLVINKAWSNRSKGGTGQHHAPHRHFMSFYSAILYLTTGAPTLFSDPLFQRTWGSFYIDSPVGSDITYHGGAGGMILFPSYMIHASCIAKVDRGDRYSIAMNTFPTGNVNSGGWGRPLAQVKVEGWKELGPLNLDDYARG
jgi:hypothetical protein|tara:strand:- start:85 stop:762 length:678 start_codon:yes stop_codon:yes gene_type:complete